MILLRGKSFGGGKRGSMAILKAFSIIFGIRRARRGQPSYRQGLLFTSISQVWN